MFRWDKDLLQDQKYAASYLGSHARLLAGPGTGKTLTLTRRICYLITEKNVFPNQILALTFTRAAAYELRKRVSDILGDQQNKLPQVSTLHSFALRQLLRNSKYINAVPQPLRIADNWEERNIILEDLKNILNCKLKIVKEKFNLLSTDWQKLTADESEWEKNFPDPKFLGAWREHRKIFGYTLRSELVYQLKKSLEQTGEFSLESDYKYLLIDEYQDMNRCDLAVVCALRDKGIEVFIAGDDDQSIYGFRYAHPEGIRNFCDEYVPSKSLNLETCLRCDKKIIDISLFVANLDPRRLEKPLKQRDDAKTGEVYLLRFQDQYFEASGVANLCKYLLNKENYKPCEILILMRSDRNNAFSSVLRKAFEANNIPVAVKAEGTPLDTNDGRIFLSILRLLADASDSLALRTLFMLRKNNQIGSKCLDEIYNLALKNGNTFAVTSFKLMENPDLIYKIGKRISNELIEIYKFLDVHKQNFNNLENISNTDNLLNSLNYLAEEVIVDTENRKKVIRYLDLVAKETNSTTLKDLLKSLSASLEDEEQELEEDSINIMTMHKAKGLTAKAVIMIAAEDEYIPGKQIGDKSDDERRLLYVSLTRAKHFLAITYCEKRIDQQRYSGREPGKKTRMLTQFLRDAPIKPINGEIFSNNL